MKPVVCVDLDGCLSDFQAAAHAFHGVPDNPVCSWNFWRDWGMSDKDFWAPLGRAFWADLPWTAEGPELLARVEALVGKDRVVLLTSPCDTPGGVEGKVEWIRKHLPEYRRRFFVGPPKSLAAGPTKVLLDDYDLNAELFAAEGGHAVLVPRPWNARRAEACPDTGRFSVDAVVAELTGILTRIGGA